jgi:hypothetical protein
MLSTAPMTAVTATTMARGTSWRSEICFSAPGCSKASPTRAQPCSGSSSVNPPCRGMQSLDLNDGEGWPGMDAYEGILRSSPQASHMPPPPVRVPLRCTLNFLLPRSAVGGGGGASTGGRAMSASVGGAHTLPLPRPHGSASDGTSQSRGHSQRRRGPVLAMADDNFDPKDAIHARSSPGIVPQPSCFRVQMLCSMDHLFICMGLANFVCHASVYCASLLRKLSSYIHKTELRAPQ